MFDVIPCIDIQGGKAVRLYEGDPEQETIYFESPKEAAQHWASLGASHLHLVDLDAALGTGNNQQAVKAIKEAVPTKLELGGGIRSLEQARNWLEELDAIVLGTLAISQPEVIDTLLADYDPERIIVSIDAKAGRVAVKGWKELSDVSATDLAQRCEKQGVRSLIYTDISRDGTMKGINPEPVKEMRSAFPHKLIGGGGVASDKDLELYESLGLEGAIVGRALYEGRISYPRTT